MGSVQMEVIMRERDGPEKLGCVSNPSHTAYCAAPPTPQPFTSILHKHCLTNKPENQLPFTFNYPLLWFCSFYYWGLRSESDHVYRTLLSDPYSLFNMMSINAKIFPKFQLFMSQYKVLLT